jgi:cadmium resistance protein CadD (predicted permease)
MSNANVVVGQILGFTIIIAFSCIGILLGQFIPPGYVEFLGFIPLLMGIQKGYVSYIEWRQIGDVEVESEHGEVEGREEEGECPNDHDTMTPNDVTSETIDAVDSETGTDGFVVKRIAVVCRHFVPESTIEVATVTIANSADNAGVYLSIFATTSDEGIGVIIAIWYVLLVLWIYSANAVVNHKQVSNFLDKYGGVIVPLVFIGLGFYILSGCIIVQKFILHKDGY